MMPPSRARPDILTPPKAAPAPKKVRAKKAVVRKGRENYLCLLNLQDMTNTAQLGGADLTGYGVAHRLHAVGGEGRGWTQPVALDGERQPATGGDGGQPFAGGWVGVVEAGVDRVRGQGAGIVLMQLEQGGAEVRAGGEQA